MSVQKEGDVPTHLNTTRSHLFDTNFFTKSCRFCVLFCALQGLNLKILPQKRGPDALKITYFHVNFVEIIIYRNLQVLGTIL